MVHGFLVIDKPIGPTSFDVIASCRRIFNEKTIGHTGTLDPLASGVLVVLLGHYTRLVDILMMEEKEYEATIHIGIGTTTDDAEGEVISSNNDFEVTQEQFEAVLRGFHGTIQQRPPLYSAIKQGGEAMYAKARRGEVVELPFREVEIHSVTLHKWNPPFVDIKVSCGKGTYIRSLARDIGTALRTYAHLSSLRRTRNGSFHVLDTYKMSVDTISNWKQMSDAEKKHIQNEALAFLKTGVSALPQELIMQVNALEAQHIYEGKTISLSHDVFKEPYSQTSKPPVGKTRIAVYEMEPIAILIQEENHWRVKRGFPFTQLVKK